MQSYRTKVWFAIEKVEKGHSAFSARIDSVSDGCLTFWLLDARRIHSIEPSSYWLGDKSTADSGGCGAGD
jgi:hypothetical protein